MGAALLGRPLKFLEIRSYGIAATLDAPSRTTYAHAARVSPCSLGTVVAARATGKEQRPLPCGSHSRRRAKQIDRAVFRLHSVHAECVQQLALLLYHDPKTSYDQRNPDSCWPRIAGLRPLFLHSIPQSSAHLRSWLVPDQLSSPARVSSPWDPLRRNRP